MTKAKEIIEPVVVDVEQAAAEERAKHELLHTVFVMRAKASRMAKEAKALNDAANGMIGEYIRRDKKYVLEGVGTLTWGEPTEISTLDKDAFIDNLVRLGVDSTVIADARKAATTDKPKAGSITFNPAKKG